jgi:hypothetical protein
VVGSAGDDLVFSAEAGAERVQAGEGAVGEELGEQGVRGWGLGY